MMDDERSIEDRSTSSAGLPSRGLPVDDTMDIEVKNEQQKCRCRGPEKWEDLSLESPELHSLVLVRGRPAELLKTHTRKDAKWNPNLSHAPLENGDDIGCSAKQNPATKSRLRWSGMFWDLHRELYLIGELPLCSFNVGLGPPTTLQETQN